MCSIESCFSSCFPFCVRMGRTLEATDEAKTEEPQKARPPPGADFGPTLEADLFYQRNIREDFLEESFELLKTRNQLTSLSRRPGEKFDSLFVLSEQSHGDISINLAK